MLGYVITKRSNKTFEPKDLLGNPREDEEYLLPPLLLMEFSLLCILVCNAIGHELMLFYLYVNVNVNENDKCNIEC